MLKFVKFGKCHKISISNHILQVGDPSISTKISDELIRRFGHYVQAINYPTVARGKEVLRVAPTPHHTKEMMDAFVKDLTTIWTEVGLVPLTLDLCSCIMIFQGPG